MMQLRSAARRRWTAVASLAVVLGGGAASVHALNDLEPASEGAAPVAEPSLSALYEEMAARVAALESRVGVVDEAQATEPVVLASLAPNHAEARASAAEARVAEAEARLAALEAKEATVRARLDEMLLDAEQRHAVITDTIQAQCQRLEELRVAQGGKLDVATFVGGLRDTMLSKDVPAALDEARNFLVNLDAMTWREVQPMLDDFASSTEGMTLGAALLEKGEQLEGLTLGHLFMGVGQQLEGMPMPEQVSQTVAMANQFGAAGYMPMVKSNWGRLSLGQLLAPMAQQCEGLCPSEAFYAMATSTDSDVLASLYYGLGETFEGLNMGHLLAILSEELAPLEVKTLLRGVEKMLQGASPSEVCSAIGQKLTTVDLGRICTRLGTALDDVSVSNALLRMSTEMDGITVGHAVADLEAVLHRAGIEIDLPAEMKQTGESLARMELPARLEALEETVVQVDGLVDDVRRELGLHPYGAVSFEPEVTVEAVATPIADEPAAPTFDLYEQVQRVEQQLEDLRAGGLGDDHPAVQKVQQRLQQLRDSLQPVRVGG